MLGKNNALNFFAAFLIIKAFPMLCMALESIVLKSEIKFQISGNQVDFEFLYDKISAARVGPSVGPLVYATCHNQYSFTISIFYMFFPYAPWDARKLFLPRPQCT